MRTVARCTLLCSILLLSIAGCRRESAAPQPESATSQPAAAEPTPGTDAPSAPPTSAKLAAVASTTAPPPSGGVLSAHYGGYGDLRFGMSAAEATQAWGGELKAVPSASEPCHYLLPKWVKVPADFALMIEGDRFVRYDVGKTGEIAPGGGTVGMDVAEIARRYPGIEHLPHKYVEGAEVLRMRDPAGGPGVLVFETDAAGKVTSWRVGVAPQVDYVEGCS